MRVRILVLAVSLLFIPPVLRTAAAHASGCAAPSSVSLTVGTVSCQELTTHLLGNGIPAPFGYYIPPGCDTTDPCPVLYLLHGFGGSYTEMVGTASAPSAWVAAETSQPPSGFETAPWLHASPAGWDPAPPLPMILVAPLGQTLPGGYGPSPGLDSYWADWNPRYTHPAPEFEHFLTDELIPFVEQHFPTRSGRGWRAIGGVSLGGFGAYKNGLQHPDLFSSMVSVSGAMNFLFAPGLDPSTVPSPLGLGLPLQLPYTQLPPLTGSIPPQSLLTSLTALGDPVADQAYFRGNTPRDLAMNAITSAGLGIDGFVNDTIPRMTSDLNDPTSLAFEDIVFPMNLDMEAAFAGKAVPNAFAIHQGVHSDAYRNAWLRGLESFVYSHLFGTTNTPTFDYRSISTDFSIWGWHVTVARQPVEFLTMRSVSCSGLSLQGTGVVTVTVPAACHTGLSGQSTFTVNLGNTYPVDDPAGLGALSVYGNTVSMGLSPV